MSPDHTPRKRGWYPSRERFETPLARRMQTPVRRRALLASLTAVLIAWPALLLLLADADTGAGTALYFGASAAWLAAVIALISLSNLAIGGITTVDPRDLDEREADERDRAAVRSRTVSTIALVALVAISPALARGGDWVAVQALVHTAFFVHVFAPHLLILWWQRDRAPEPDPDGPAVAPDRGAPA